MEKQHKLKLPVEDSPAETSEMEEDDDCSEAKFVWPWVGLVANIPTVVEKSGRRVGKSGSTLRDELIVKGFDPTRVQPIWDFKGHSGFALVEFSKDFQGFENAMKFERSYESDRHGKRDWEKGMHSRDDKPYGWVAREADYNGSGIVGKNVKKKRDLKTVSQIQQEDDRKMVQLVTNMSQSIEMKKICKQELEDKVNENALCLESLEIHNDMLNKTYQEEAEKMQKNVQELYQHILKGHAESMSDLERQREMMEERARQIDINEAEMQKSRLEREMKSTRQVEQILNQKFPCFQIFKNLKHDKFLQKEKEKLHAKIMAMEAKLNERQELELEIEKLKMSTNVMKHMVGSDGDAEARERALEEMAKSQREFEARERALQDEMMALSQRERMTNDEYQDARKELIKFWKVNDDLVKEEKIRVKVMGQLDPEPFLPAVMRKHKLTKSRAEMKAMELCSFWAEQIGDVHWNPFKVIESGGTAKRVVDKKDGKLRKLKNDYGEEVYDEVVRTKLEIEEYNASGGYVISEIWNYEEKRKATIEEAVDVMLKIRKDLAAKVNKRQRL
ncbi:unnamed protein product [Microthlaspi erraticum]|uniref:XS domain-containing protein n=1 Tax=Microthlaspi erraticum TaxID=1685480 RepID=A0A6D2J495_9BRAS|nr:unnamed protein product [Microthlaspi erraticum]